SSSAASPRRSTRASACPIPSPRRGSRPRAWCAIWRGSWWENDRVSSDSGADRRAGGGGTSCHRRRGESAPRDQHRTLPRPPPAPGEWVLIHVGFAMTRISAEQAVEQLRLLAMLGEDVQAMTELEGYAFDALQGGKDDS